MDINSERYIRIGSTKKQVKDILGEPSKVDAHMWTYGTSHIKFNRDDEVVEWKNMFDQLSKGMIPYEASDNYFFIGSSENEVLLALGSPTAVSYMRQYIWKYESSHIKFEKDGKVIEWKNMFDQLDNGLQQAKEGASHIELGSSKEEVVDALGSPDMILAMYPYVWKYDSSHVTFDKNGHVVEWRNLYDQLEAGMKKPEICDDYIIIGSSSGDVLKVLGSPTSILESNINVWKYESSHVMFEKGYVIEWRNFYGQLDEGMKKAGYGGFVEVGSTQEEILDILGSPTSISKLNPEVWHYDSSHVKFTKGCVVEWRNMFHKLDKGMRHGSECCGDIGVGSDQETVLKRLGSPTSILEKEPKTWHYGNASVNFDSNNTVVSWHNIDDIKKNIEML